MNSDTVNEKPGSLSTWLDYLEGINPDKIELGLSRVKKVLDKLDLTIFKNIPVVEVAGTNGKGSTAALIASSLSFCGIKSGLYTSPHLHKFNERVVIDGKIVSDEQLALAFKTVHDNCGDVQLTYFEYTTLAALVCFSNANVDVAVLEVGLGGRLDAVNVIDATISVITSIGLDHTHILGDTIEKIAYEKAGIIKPNSSVVTGQLSQSALDVISKCASERNATVYAQDDNFFGNFDDGFVYEEKTSNNIVVYKFPYPKIPYCCAPAAMRVLTLLKNSGLHIHQDGVKQAIQTVSLPGRMQIARFNPLVILDVAHNPPAATHLAEVLAKRVKIAARYAVIGMLKDKDVESVLSILSSSFDGFYVASLHTQRGEQAQRLYSALVANGIDKNLIKSFDTVDLALQSAINESAPHDEIICVGSFVTVSEAMDFLNTKND